MWLLVWKPVLPTCTVASGLTTVFLLHLVLQALKPHIFVSVPRLWNRIYDRVMATMREANPVKRRLFETAFAYKRAALEAGGLGFGFAAVAVQVQVG